MATTVLKNPATTVDNVPLSQESFARYSSRISTRLAIPTGIFIALLVYLLNTDRQLIPLSDDLRSFGVISLLAMIPLSAITAGWGYLLSIRAWNARVDLERQRRIRWAFVPISITYMLFATGIFVVAILFIEQAFRNLALSMVQSLLLTGLGCAAFVFWIVGDVMKLNTRRLLTLAVVILATGVYLSLTAIEDPFWWRVSFSYLGKIESNVNWLFNATLVFSGILLLIWRIYFMSDYRILVQHGITSGWWSVIISYGLLWIAIAVMIVGIFKSQLTPISSLMHNTAAYSMAGVFLLFMLGGRWIAPGFPHEFHALSGIVVAVLIGTITWAIIGGVNTVGLELTVFALGLMWLSQFARNTEDLATELEPEAFAR